MKAVPVPTIDGAYLFEPTPHADDRGFCRTFDKEVAGSVGIDPDAFVQDSISRSVRGVIRGMHVRSGAGEAKLVRCSYGGIFDVVVDLRSGSPTYRNCGLFELSGMTQISLHVRAGCTHGSRRSQNSLMLRTGSIEPHHPSEDVAIAFDDPDLRFRGRFRLLSRPLATARRRRWSTRPKHWGGACRPDGRCRCRHRITE